MKKIKINFKKIFNKYVIVAIIAAITILVIGYLIYSGKYMTLKYENAAGDKYTMVLTMKNNICTEANVKIKLSGKTKKDKENNVKYTYDLLLSQTDKYKDVKVKNNIITYKSIKEMALKKDRNKIKKLYKTELYKNIFIY